VSAAPLDRATIAAAVMDDLITISLDIDDDAVGVARIVASRGGVFAGGPVVREIMGRVGVRTRALVAEGEPVVAGTAVLELGGPIAAIRGVAPLALTWVTRCGAVASGATPPEAGNPIDAYAARLSARAAVGHDGPSFRLEIDPDTTQRSEQGIEG
jgi:hypothetical protein